MTSPTTDRLLRNFFFQQVSEVKWVVGLWFVGIFGGGRVFVGMVSLRVVGVRVVMWVSVGWRLGNSG